jgi:hypothetical protein
MEFITSRVLSPSFKRYSLILLGLPWMNNGFLFEIFKVSVEGKLSRKILFSSRNSLTVQGREKLLIGVSLI